MTTDQDTASDAVPERIEFEGGFLIMQESRRLSDRDRDIFLALLDADTEPTEAAKAAAKEYNKGRRVGNEYHFEL